MQEPIERKGSRSLSPSRPTPSWAEDRAQRDNAQSNEIGEAAPAGWNGAAQQVEMQGPIESRSNPYQLVVRPEESLPPRPRPF